MGLKSVHTNLKNAVLVGLAIVIASVSCQVNDRDLGSHFTHYSGAEFADKSRELDIGYDPTPMPVVREMLKLASVGPSDFLIDLGSGDGRIVITAAKEFGARGFGVELNQELVELSRHYAKHMRVAHRASFSVEDLFMSDLSKADVVTLYLHPEVNLKLRPKLWSELSPGTRVVSHDYHMGDWRPDKIMVMDIDRPDSTESILYLWIMPSRISGKWQWRIAMPGGEQRFSVEFNQHFQDIGGVAGNEKGKWRLFDATLRGSWIAFSLVTDEQIEEKKITNKNDGQVCVLVEQRQPGKQKGLRTEKSSNRITEKDNEDKTNNPGSGASRERFPEKIQNDS